MQREVPFCSGPGGDNWPLRVTIICLPALSAQQRAFSKAGGSLSPRSQAGTTCQREAAGLPGGVPGCLARGALYWGSILYCWCQIWGCHTGSSANELNKAVSQTGRVQPCMMRADGVTGGSLEVLGEDRAA